MTDINTIPAGFEPPEQPQPQAQANPQPQVQASPYNPYAAPAPRPAPPAPPREKKRFPLTNADLGMALAALLLAVFGVASSFWGGFRLGYALAFDLSFLVYAVYLGALHKRAGAFAWCAGLLSFAVSAVFVFTSNEAVRALSVLAMGVGGVTFLSALSGAERISGDLGLLRSVLGALGDVLGGVGRSLASLFGAKSGKFRLFSRVMLGLVIAIPALLVIVPLLVKSDFAFEGLVKSIFFDVGTRAAQLVLALLFFPLMLSFAYSNKYREKKEVRELSFKGVDTVVLCTFFGVLSLVYVLYLVSQAAYFFSGFRNLLPEGYSTAEYARRGFFEMCAIAGVNFALLFLAVLIARKKENGALPAAVKGLGTFIGAFTLVLIVTALSKMRLYILNYGMTVLRVATSAFMALLSVVFLTLILRLYIKRINVLRIALVGALLSLLALGVVNVNRVVAEYNRDAFLSGKLKTVDVFYLEELGPEGVPVLYDLTKCENDDVSRKAHLVLRHALESYYEAGVLREEDYAARLGDQVDNERYYVKLPYSENGKYFGSRKGQFDYFEKYETALALGGRTYAKLSQWSLPLSRAYASFERIMNEEPDFLSGSYAAHGIYEMERPAYYADGTYRDSW